VKLLCENSNSIFVLHWLQKKTQESLQNLQYMCSAFNVPLPFNNVLAFFAHLYTGDNAALKLKKSTLLPSKPEHLDKLIM
jgi:hypothetical protein